jgi:hypothetical protein
VAEPEQQPYVVSLILCSQIHVFVQIFNIFYTFLACFVKKLCSHLTTQLSCGSATALENYFTREMGKMLANKHLVRITKKHITHVLNMFSILGRCISFLHTFFFGKFTLLVAFSLANGVLSNWCFVQVP